MGVPAARSSRPCWGRAWRGTRGGGRAPGRRRGGCARSRGGFEEEGRKKNLNNKKYIFVNSLFYPKSLLLRCRDSPFPLLSSSSHLSNGKRKGMERGAGHVEAAGFPKKKKKLSLFFYVFFFPTHQTKPLPIHPSLLDPNPYLLFPLLSFLLFPQYNQKDKFDGRNPLSSLSNPLAPPSSLFLSPTVFLFLVVLERSSTPSHHHHPPCALLSCLSLRGYVPRPRLRGGETEISLDFSVFSLLLSLFLARRVRVFG